MEGNCGSSSSSSSSSAAAAAEPAVDEGDYSSCNNLNSNEERHSAFKKKKFYGILALCVTNIILCTSLLIICSKNQSLLIVALINLIFTILAGIAFAVHISQLLIVCVIYKILCATYLSFLICKLIDAIAMEQSSITAENIWRIIALICTTIEISLFRLLMNIKIEMDEEKEEDERIQQSPPKYSACALTSSSTNSQLPSYHEALRIIEKQKDGMPKQNSEVQTLQPVFTIPITGATKSAFKENISV